MSVQSECDHDFGYYRPVAGSGQDIVHECSKCGNRVVQEGAKTKFYRELKEEENKTRKKQSEHKKRKARASQKAKEDEDSVFDKAEEGWEYTKDKIKDIFD
jgi:hypothetical protein